MISPAVRLPVPLVFHWLRTRTFSSSDFFKGPIILGGPLLLEAPLLVGYNREGKN